MLTDRGQKHADNHMDFNSLKYKHMHILLEKYPLDYIIFLDCFLVINEFVINVIYTIQTETVAQFTLPFQCGNLCIAVCVKVSDAENGESFTAAVMRHHR